MDSIYRQILLCLRGEISASDAASKANAESSMNFNSAKTLSEILKICLKEKYIRFNVDIGILNSM